jgi:zinc/manganese transport system permease protein
MGLLHGYAGLHVLRRGVIFVDLALAQMAALGAVVSLFFAAHASLQKTHPGIAQPRTSLAAAAGALPQGGAGGDELDRAIESTGLANAGTVVGAEEHHGEGLLDLWPTAFALAGAVLLAFSRLGGERVPHEAIIGVIYVVAAATTVLLLSKSPHGHEQMEEMLTGKLLFIDRTEVLTTGALYAGLGLLHVIFFRPFLAISSSPEQAEKSGMRVRLWDTLFYAMFAIMVTRSVAVAGVLVVFSFLIIPGACAAMFVDSFKWRIVIAWAVASIVSVLGMAISAIWDLPSGSTVVATFGATLLLSVCLGAIVRRSRSITGMSAPTV